MKKSKFKTITFVTWLFPKLSETFVMNQIVEFKKKGYRVKILAVKDPRKQLAREDSEFENVVHSDVWKHGLLKNVTYSDIPGLQKILKKQISKKQTDVIYFQFPDLASQVLKGFDTVLVPVLTTFYDIPEFKDKKDLKAVRGKYIHAFEKSDSVLATSEYTRRLLIELGCDPNKIVVHYAGIDLSKFRPIPRGKRKGADKFTFLMVGRFVEKKGFINGIRAYDKARKKIRNKKTQLHIVGDGVLKDELIDEVKRLGISDSVFFHGKLAQGDVIKLITRSNVVVCPSVTTNDGKREGLPTVIIESVSCGVPVIASDHAAIPEIVKPREDMLVKENDITGIARFMLVCIGDYHRCLFKARKRMVEVRRAHSVTKQAEKLEVLISRFSRKRDQEFHLSRFARNIDQSLKREIYSIALTGSLARYEEQSFGSDIDVMIVFKKNNSISRSSLEKIRKEVIILRDKIGLEVSPQIFAKADVFDLLSPVLMQSYIEDGKILLGKDIKIDFVKHLHAVSAAEFSLGVAKRIIFRRFFVRQYLSVNDGKVREVSRRLAKDVLFMVSDYLSIGKKRVITNKDEIVLKWSEENSSLVPEMALRIMRKKNDSNFQKKFCDMAVGFIEKMYPLATKEIQRKYSRKTIKIDAI